MRNSLFFTYQLSIMMTCLACGSDGDPEPVDCSASGLSISILNQENASCNQNSGSIEVNFSGSGSNLQYSLSGSPFQPAAGVTTIEDIAPGAQTLVLRDDNECTVSENFTIGEVNDLTVELVSQISGCNTPQGSVSANVQGGTEPFSYSLDGGSPQNGNTFSGLAAGDYTILVSDSEGCETSSSVSVLSGVSFSEEIKPIIDNNCALSNCHDGSNAGIPNWTVLSNVQDNAANIKTRTSDMTMPPSSSGITLEQSEIDAIGCWVDDGALNN